MSGYPNSFGYFHQVVVELDNDQIVTLPTLDVELIPTPGANRVLCPLFGEMKIDHEAAGYSNFTADGSFIRFSIGDTPRLTDIIASDGGALSDQATDYCSMPPAVTRPSAPTNVSTLILGSDDFDSTVIDMPLIIKAFNDGVNFNGGNAANTLRVAVMFMVQDAVTGRFLLVDETGWDEAAGGFA